MSVSILRRLALAGLLVMSVGAAVGCQRNLFADDDESSKWTLKRYYDNDSAVETSESRKRGGDTAFGIPMGGGQQ